MKAIVALSLSAIAVVAMLNAARPVINAHQQQLDTERYAQQKVDRDARMQAACDAHSTGVVLFYKGKDCSL